MKPSKFTTVIDRLPVTVWYTYDPNEPAGVEIHWVDNENGEEVLPSVEQEEILLKMIETWLNQGQTKKDLFQRLPPQASRDVRLQLLQDYYLQYLVEDAQDGTPLDSDVLDMIDKLKIKYQSAI